MRPSFNVDSGRSLDEFWNGFINQYWGKRPVVIKRPFASPIINLQRLFASFVQASEAYKRFEGGIGVRIYLEHANHRATVERRYFASVIDPPYYHLPSSTDRSFETFFRRVSRRFGRHRLGLMWNDCQAYDWIHFLRLRSFLGGLISREGMPLGGTFSSIFLGNYRYTPFGIHRDPFHVFTFILKGTKRMLVWPQAQFENRPEAKSLQRVIVRDGADYRRAMRTAACLEGTAGDLMYWPSSYWHRSEPAGSLSITLPVAVDYSPPLPARTLLGPAGTIQVAGKSLPSPANAHRYPLSHIKKQLRTFPRPSRLYNLREQATGNWLAFLSSGGFRVPPPPMVDVQSLRAGEWIRGSSETPIIATRIAPSKLLMAANGHSTLLEGVPQTLSRVEEILALLNSGRPLRHRELAARLAGKEVTRRRAGPVMATELSHLLLTWHAIERHPR